MINKYENMDSNDSIILSYISKMSFDELFNLNINTFNIECLINAYNTKILNLKNKHSSNKLKNISLVKYIYKSKLEDGIKYLKLNNKLSDENLFNISSHNNSKLKSQYFTDNTQKSNYYKSYQQTQITNNNGNTLVVKKSVNNNNGKIDETNDAYVINNKGIKKQLL
uniref:Uncharacterized protein n=1 Tax=viral metagenome TaxID=1070528 RepID=A0A6C0H8R1_9ZZZZ